MVGADDALITQAEAAGKIEAAWQGAEIARGLGGGAGKALLELRAEAGEDGVGLFQCRGVDQTEFADQTVLEGAPDALDATLGLGRVGGNLLNAEFVQGASQL